MRIRREMKVMDAVASNKRDVGKEPIYVLYLINDFGVGGAEKALARIVSGLPQNKYHITVVGFKEGRGHLKSILDKAGIDYFVLGAKHKMYIFALYRLFRYLRSHRVDVLWTSLFHATIAGRVIGSAARLPVLINWEHNANLGPWVRRLLLRLTLPLADAVIADSKATAGALSRADLIPKSHFYVVPIGGLKVAKYKKHGQERGEKTRVGTVANLLPQKGIDLLLQVAQKAGKLRPEVEFILVGDGPLRPDIESRVQHIKMGEQIKVLGWREDVPALLNSFDIYFQPSRWEGMGMAVIEAMAAGLPVVASDVGGHKESIVDGETGFLVENGDVDGMKDALLKLIDDPSLRKRMGRAGQQRASEKYSLTGMIKKLEKILDRLMEEKGSNG